MPPIEVSPSEWTIIESILKKHLPHVEIWAFGSRAKWTAKPYSDLDLVLINEKPLGFKKIGALKKDFEDSKLPFTVDLLEWVSLTESFQKMIQADHVTFDD